MKALVKQIGCSALVMARKRLNLLAAAVVLVGMGAMSFGQTVTPLETATELGTDFTSNTTSYINAAVPIILGIFGLMLGLSIIMSWGKRAAH